MTACQYTVYIKNITHYNTPTTGVIVRTSQMPMKFQKEAKCSGVLPCSLAQSTSARIFNNCRVRIEREREKQNRGEECTYIHMCVYEYAMVFVHCCCQIWLGTFML